MGQRTDAVKCKTVQYTYIVKAHRNSRSIQYILETLSSCQPCGKQQAKARETLNEVIPSPYAEGCTDLGSGEEERHVALPQTQLSRMRAPPAPSPPPLFPFLLKTVQ